jgi:hypothetical protein
MRAARTGPIDVSFAQLLRLIEAITPVAIAAIRISPVLLSRT